MTMRDWYESIIETTLANFHSLKAAEGERNIHKLCDDILVNGRQRFVVVL